MDSWGRDFTGVLAEPPNDCGSPLFAPFYFVSFMVLTTYVSLNIMVAVILHTFFDIEGSPGAELLDDHRVETFMKTTERPDVDYDAVRAQQLILSLPSAVFPRC